MRRACHDFNGERRTRWKPGRFDGEFFFGIRILFFYLQTINYVGYQKYYIPTPICGIIVQLFCLYKPAERLMTVDCFLESSTSMSAAQLHRCSTFNVQPLNMLSRYVLSLGTSSLDVLVHGK